MKKNNLLRIGWIVGIYSILVLILYLVVTYKVKWEDKDLNTYLYFYNCSNSLCTSTEKQNNYYGSIICENEKCPYIVEKNNDYLILNNNNKQILYDYKKDKIINDSYDTYKLTSDENYIVSKNNKYAVINDKNEVLVDFTDKTITDYKYEYISYRKNGKYGIINEKSSVDISPVYEEVILIDSRLYSYLEEEKYYISSYDTEIPINGNSYDYLVSIDNILLVFNNKQLDILDTNLNSQLLMKIDCTYDYRVEKERKTLNINKLNNIVTFTINEDDNEYTNYYYDLKNKKLIN